MEYRRLGLSGLTVPALSFGTGTFGGVGRLAAWGSTDATEARRLVDICLDAGVSMFDSANVYSLGESERVLGQAIKGRRDKVLISTKATFRFGDGPNDLGSSRQNLLAAIDGSLGRLGTDYIDLFQLHGFDAFTPPEEVLATLDVLVRAGKIRYVGVSNFSGWHLMKSLAVADKYGFPRYVANQTYYSLIGRDYEWELMPLGLDQGLGAVGDWTLCHVNKRLRRLNHMPASMGRICGVTTNVFRSSPLSLNTGTIEISTRSHALLAALPFPWSNAGWAYRTKCIQTPAGSRRRVFRSNRVALPSHKRIFNR